jgi:hypothetical protein
MNVLNGSKSSEYFDSLVDEREDSAVSVIHGAWLEHTSTLGRLEHLEPMAPLDMLILYQAAAATFKDWAPEADIRGRLLPGGRVINREHAWQHLQSVQDPERAALATKFANQVIALSAQSATEQDLLYYVELFLRSIADKRVIERILSGEISRNDNRLSDPDYW